MLQPFDVCIKDYLCPVKVMVLFLYITGRTVSRPARNYPTKAEVERNDKDRNVILEQL